MDGILGRVLMDPATGLPNAPYFDLIRDWEARRARRRRYSVRVLTAIFRGGSERLRRSLGWRVARELRGSDLLASAGAGNFRVLLTSPDAEHADRIAQRVQQIAGELNRLHPGESPLTLTVRVEESAGGEGEGDDGSLDADASPASRVSSTE